MVNGAYYIVALLSIVWHCVCNNCFLVAWTADAGALVFGKLFGKYTPKLMPRTSPNKTVASLLGAIVVGLLTMTS